ncbi:MAG: amidohydrolase [Bacteroidetes bacterium]|nr:MAG: amidohydrolase [Bacteroidota bacterium]
MKTKILLTKGTLVIIILFCISFITSPLSAQGKYGPADSILLKDYRPVSLYKIPVTKVDRAAFPAIDVHTHDNYAKTEEEVAKWIKIMDDCNIEKCVVFTMATGARFDSIVQRYSKYSKRFEMWCGFDFTGCDKPGYGPAAVKELERCHRMGASGVGEVSDKGLGIRASGMHFDDPRLKPLFAKCAELNMPINIHVADPIWFYEKMDSHNDGLMEAQAWAIDMTKPGIIGYEALIQTLENAVKNNPKTTFIACHFANLNQDMTRLGALLDNYPNLYADISARFEMTATIPRFAKAFYEKYQDRLLYGTDMGASISIYRATFRILETNDEHFYVLSYQWAKNGIGLSKEVLKKVYHDNAAKILKLK